MGEHDQWSDTDWEKPAGIGGAGDVRAIPKSSILIIRPLMKAWSAFNVWVYRLSAGRLLGSFLGAPVCLVTMTGRKTGKIRTIPLIYLPHDDDVILVASQGGMDTHPVWYHNLVANPEVEVQDGARRRKLLARRASDQEKRELWPHILSIYKDFAGYQERTSRNIPVFICSPN